MRNKLTFLLVLTTLVLCATNVFQFYKSWTRPEKHCKWWELQEGQFIPHTPEGQPNPRVPTMLGGTLDDRPDTFTLVQNLDGKVRMKSFNPVPWNSMGPYGYASYGSAVVAVIDFGDHMELGLWHPMTAQNLSDGGIKYIIDRTDPYAENLLYLYANGQGQITAFSAPQAETEDKDLAVINLPMPISLREDRVYSVTITGDSVPTGLWTFRLWKGKLVQSVGHLAGYTPDPPS